MNQKYLDKAIEAQKDFVYEEIFTGKGYGVYLCHNPKNSNYSFEIITGKMGIYVGGDIDSIVYRVGRSLEFLAGNDIDYYQHSKLEHIYLDKKELDQDMFNEYLRDMLWEGYENSKEFKFENKKPSTLKAVINFYETNDLNVSTYKAIGTSTFNAWDLYEQINGLTDLHEIYGTIASSHVYNGEMPNITKSDYGVMFSMYMAHVAAKKILEQKKPTDA